MRDAKGVSTKSGGPSAEGAVLIRTGGSPDKAVSEASRTDILQLMASHM